MANASPMINEPNRSMAPLFCTCVEFLRIVKAQAGHEAALEEIFEPHSGQLIKVIFVVRAIK